VVVSALRARGQKIEEDARELARANAQLEQTNRKLDESYRQLHQADKMASLGLMSGTVIHDLRNHLQALITVAECELEDRNGSEQAWALVLKQARAMRELADSVRRFAAKSAGRRVACDLHAVVEDALLILHKAIKSSGVTLRRELAARSAIVEGDPNELLQLAINLLQNALDAMPAGGEFRVATRDAPDSGVELVVADTGAGIPRELRERVFEAFFTTKPEDKGTGLGLAICKRIVESHRGSLTLESEEGVGASFRVLLPLATPPIKIT
jgi:signal transduction histidine kinase